MTKCRAWDKANNQMLTVVQICWEDHGEPFLRKGIVGHDDKGNFYRLAFEDVDLEWEVQQ